MNAWIEWNGGDCPVSADALVEVRLRSSDCGTARAGEYIWGWISAASDHLLDIVAYRLAYSETGESAVGAPVPALERQEGGDHYKKLKIQPMEYSMANGLDACQHTVIKYVTRFRDKGGVADLRKAIHTLEMLIEFEEQKTVGLTS